MRAILISLLWIIPSICFTQSLAVVTSPADVDLDPQGLTRIDQLINIYIQHQTKI